MTKPFFVSCCSLILAWSANVHAGHEALEVLFENGSQHLKAAPSCEPYQLAENPQKDAQTLAQDIAWVLADMSDKSINSDASCDKNPSNKKTCKVIFSIGEGELEWARVYQFETVPNKKGRNVIKGLTCFNLP